MLYKYKVTYVDRGVVDLLITDGDGNSVSKAPGLTEISETVCGMHLKHPNLKSIEVMWDGS